MSSDFSITMKKTKGDRIMQVEMKESACPICRKDVYGNPEMLFLCRDCFVLFKEEHLVKREESIETDQTPQHPPGIRPGV